MSVEAKLLTVVDLPLGRRKPGNDNCLAKYLFHGAILEPQSYWGRAIDGPERVPPMQLVRVGSFLPSITCPMPQPHFVVTEEVKHLISELAGGSFLEVTVSKLVEGPDLDMFRNAKWTYCFDTFEDYLMSLPECEKSHMSRVKYFELFVPSFERIWADYVSEPIRTIGKVELVSVLSLAVAAGLLEQYPIIGAGNGLVLQNETLLKLQRHLDQAFFEVRSLEIARIA